jgi:ribulose-phosphate 3-epimerase
MSTEGKNILISPSIIATDMTIIGEQAEQFDGSVIHLLHMDVMDGHFVPNMTFGPAFIRDLKKHTSIPLDVHLMIEHPERSLDQYVDIAPWCVTIHYESTRFPARILQEIRSAGIVAGLAINPATPVESAFDLLSFTDMVLVMSVDPGFYGQAFMEISLPKITKLSDFIKANHSGAVRIQVDGGINAENIGRIVRAGAGIIVAGNSAFKGGDVNGNVRKLLDAALI